jgi:hypothetical protein
MKRDITPLLKEWPYQPGQVNARLITDTSGAEKVQVRVDLGLLQMNAEGRPDGETPFGFQSLLEYFEARLDGEIDEVRDESKESPKPPSPPAPPEPRKGKGRKGTPPPQHAEPPEADGHDAAREETRDEARANAEADFKLTPEDCRALREEAAQFYQRYVACLALEEFDRVIRDTTRNLRVLDMCSKYAQEESDRTVLEQFRAYIIMVRSRALASQAIKDNELKAGVLALDEAMDMIKRHYEHLGRPKAFESSEEVRMLRSMKEALVPKLPISQRDELRQRLQRAIDTENYELAAILRDELKQLKDGL